MNNPTPAASHLRYENGNFTYCPEILPAIEGQQVIYEVFRVDKGVPLFVNDHLKRLFAGVAKLGLKIGLSENELNNHLNGLIEKSGVQAGNIKIEVYFSDSSVKHQYLRAFFIPTNYPDNDLYQNGVECIFLDAMRKTPSIKIADKQLRSKSDNLLVKENIYETVLVDNKGLITEGSRSNIFLIKRDVIYTAPCNMVLEGIMRQKVLEIINGNNIELKIEAVCKEDTELFDAAFLTGTSPRIIHIKRLGDKFFKVPHKLIIKISENLTELINFQINKYNTKLK